MEGIGTMETNSRQVLSLLEKIKSSKGRKLNKLGELLNKGGKTFLDEGLSGHEHIGFFSWTRQRGVDK